MRIVLVRAGVWAMLGLLAAVAPMARAAPVLSFHVVAEHPHDPSAFTEGLAIDRGRLIESTGRYGRSLLLISDLATGRSLKSRRLDDRDFGEGVAVVGSHIIQLTWKGGVGFVYDFDLNRTGSFHISSEGWGLTYDGRRLIRSDGSSTLQMIDPRTFRETRRIAVRDGLQSIARINELEYANGWLYANVWMTDRIAVIDPRSGMVHGWLDLADLRQRFPKPPDWDEADYVLNGIAYDPTTGHFFVTGKCWPVMYEIALDRRPPR